MTATTSSYVQCVPKCVERGRDTFWFRGYGQEVPPNCFSLPAALYPLLQVSDLNIQIRMNVNCLI